MSVNHYGRGNDRFAAIQYDVRASGERADAEIAEVKRLDDADVMRLAALACNSLPYGEMDMPTAVWIGDTSMGIRDIAFRDGRNDGVRKRLNEDSDIYSYTGYDIADLETVVIGSATSGATITMSRVELSGTDEDEGAWQAEFDPGYGESVMYRRLFSAIGKTGLWDMNKDAICWGETPVESHDDYLADAA